MRNFLLYDTDSGEWSTESAKTHCGAAKQAARKLDDSGMDDDYGCTFRVDYAPPEWNGDYPELEYPELFGECVTIQVARREDGNGGWAYSFREVYNA